MKWLYILAACFLGLFYVEMTHAQSWLATTTTQDRLIERLNGTLDDQKTVSSDTLYSLLVNDRHVSPEILTVAPGEYTLVTNGKISEFQASRYECSAFVISDLTPSGDCKDYARRAIAAVPDGVAMGYMLVELNNGHLHMLNAFVNPDGELWAYDPMVCSYPGGGIAKILKISFGYPMEALL